MTLSREATAASDISADADSVAANYFETLGIRLIAGRAFDPHDRRDTPRVAIINQAMARQLWGDTTATAAATGAATAAAEAAPTKPTATPTASESAAVGRRFWRPRGAHNPPEAYEVIGIAANSRYTSLWEDRPRVFFALSQTESFPNVLILRARHTLAADTLAAAIRDAVAANDPQLPLPKIQSWPETRESALTQQRLGLTLFATFSTAMLLLTIVGLYSVMTSRVTQRRHEIAIRLALGAAPQQMRRSILKQSTVIAACGLIPGLASGAAATSVIARILPGLEPSTPTAAIAIGLTLIAITTLATLAPARRAASTDPMRVLQEQ